MDWSAPAASDIDTLRALADKTVSQPSSGTGTDNKNSFQLTLCSLSSKHSVSTLTPTQRSEISTTR